MPVFQYDQYDLIRRGKENHTQGSLSCEHSEMPREHSGGCTAGRARQGDKPCCSNDRSEASSHLEPCGRFGSTDTFIWGLLPPKLCRLAFCCLKLPKIVRFGGGNPGKVIKANLFSSECFCYFTQGSFHSLLF